MNPIDRRFLALKAIAIDTYLDRIARALPADAAALESGSLVADSVLFNLLQATQAAIDIAVSSCVMRGLGAPTSYGNAFERLRDAGILEAGLAARLVAACGFRNAVAHKYEALDMTKALAAARQGPGDLRAFIQAIRDAK